MYTTTNSFNWFDHDLVGGGGGSIAERTLRVFKNTRTGKKNMQWMNYIQMTSIYWGRASNSTPTPPPKVHWNGAITLRVLRQIIDFNQATFLPILMRIHLHLPWLTLFVLHFAKILTAAYQTPPLLYEFIGWAPWSTGVVCKHKPLIPINNYNDIKWTILKFNNCSFSGG